MSTPAASLDAALAQRCARGPISFRDYIDCVLYTPEVGYYRQARARVARDRGSDFYTAESLGRVFAELVVAAAVDLLEGAAPRHHFVEIGAEPERRLLDALETAPFASQRVIRPGEALELAGPSVVFANEWLDALPFHRLIFKDAAWRERGVARDASGHLKEVLLPALSPAVAAVADRLPPQIEEGYELDLPLAAEDALARLLQQDWSGLLLLFDYGRTWPALLQNHPSGTARTYRQHRQGNNLLEAPGHCDITCDVCWTPLEAQLQAAGCQPVQLESQEAFFVKRSQRAAEAIVANSAGRFSADRQTLMELIHPANMGQRFQVLWARRPGRG
jgi:SAM-dependent MidA family methyltransferase